MLNASSTFGVFVFVFQAFGSVLDPMPDSHICPTTFFFSSQLIKFYTIHVLTASIHFND